MPLCLHFNNNKESTFIEHLPCPSFCSHFKTTAQRKAQNFVLFYYFADPEARLKKVYLSQMVRNPPAVQDTWVWSLDWEDPPGGGHGNLLQNSCLENPMDSRAWWAAVRDEGWSQRVGHDPVSKHSTHTTHQNGTGCAAAEPAHITRELWATVFLHSILLVSKGVILHF